MAVGARGRDILAQFIVAALTLSLIGGLIGIALGVAGALAPARLADWPMPIQPQGTLLAFGFAASLRRYLGLYPASRERKTGEAGNGVYVLGDLVAHIIIKKKKTETSK